MSNSQRPLSLEPPESELQLRHCPILEQSPDFSDGSKIQHCSSCETGVHNLSAMTEADAQALIEARDDLCVRYQLDSTGHPIFQRSVHAIALKMARAAGFGLALGLAACGGSLESGKEAVAGYLGKKNNHERKLPSQSASSSAETPTSQPESGGAEPDAESQSTATATGEEK